MNQIDRASASPPGEDRETRVAWRSDLLALALLTLLALVYYRQMILAGWIYAAPDAQLSAGASAPLRAALAQGIYPLWNPYLLSGMPSYASLMAVPYVNPPSLVNHLIDALSGVERRWDLLLHTILAGMGVYVYLRMPGDKEHSWRVSTGAALFGGVAFQFSIHSLSMVAYAHNSKLMTATYLPWVLWATERLLRQPNLRRAVLLALLLGLQLLTAHLQMAYYTWLAVGLAAIFSICAQPRSSVVGQRRRTTFLSIRVHLYSSVVDLRRHSAVLRKLGMLCLALLAGLALSAVLTLPVANYARYSTRGGDGLSAALAAGWSLWPAEMLTFLLPNLFGYGDQTYWGGLTFADFPHYVGGLAALLAVLYLRPPPAPPIFCENGGGRGGPYLAALLLISALLACGEYLGPLYQVERALLPFYQAFRAPAQALILAEFSLAALGGLGLQALLDGRLFRQGLLVTGQRLWLLAGLALTGTLLALAFQQPLSAWLSQVDVTGSGGTVADLAEATLSTGSGDEALGMARFQMALGDGWRLVFLLSCLALLAWGYSKAYLSRRALVGFLIALLVLDLWQIAAGLPAATPAQSRPEKADAGEVADWLKAQVCPAWQPGSPQQDCLYRLLPLGALFTDNTWAARGVQSAGGFHAARLRLYQQFIDHFSLPEQAHPRALALLNVGWVLSLQPLDASGEEPSPLTPPVKNTGLPSRERGLELMGWLNVGQDQDARAWVYRNTAVLPRAWLVEEALIAQAPSSSLESGSEASALQMLDDLDFDPARQAILLQAPPIQPMPGEPGQAIVEDYQLHSLRVRTQADTPRLLVFSEVYYPAGWRSYLDGQETPLLQADYLLRAVSVPAGEHVVTLRFEPWDIRAGAIISLAAALLILIGLAAGVAPTAPLSIATPSAGPAGAVAELAEANPSAGSPSTGSGDAVVEPAEATPSTGSPSTGSGDAVAEPAETTHSTAFRQAQGSWDAVSPGQPVLETLAAHLPLPHLLWRIGEWQALRRVMRVEDGRRGGSEDCDCQRIATVRPAPTPHATGEWGTPDRPCVLDLGCGDGWFGWMLFPSPPLTPPPFSQKMGGAGGGRGGLIGADRSLAQARQANRRGIYSLVVVAEAGRLPFRQDCLAALVANSSLEHVIDLESALQEVHRTLLPGGRAYLTVPSGHFPAMLFHATWLSWLGMHQLARAYATWLNAYLEHRHIGNLAFWEDRLRAAGLHLLSVHTLLPRRALWLWEIGLPAQYFLRRLNRWLPWYSWLRRARARWLTGGLPELTITDGQEGAVWLLEVADE